MRKRILLRIFAHREGLNEGAGERFAQALDDTLQHLRNHPELAPVFDRPMRRLVVSNTGYGLFYTVEARGIFVHALVHLSQNPESIRARIRRLLKLE